MERVLFTVQTEASQWYPIFKIKTSFIYIYIYIYFNIVHSSSSWLRKLRSQYLLTRQKICYIKIYINIYKYMSMYVYIHFLFFIKLLFDTRKIIIILIVKHKKIIKKIIFALFLLQKVILIMQKNIMRPWIYDFEAYKKNKQRSTINYTIIKICANVCVCRCVCVWGGGDIGIIGQYKACCLCHFIFSSKLDMSRHRSSSVVCPAFS